MIGYIIKCTNQHGIDEPLYDEHGRLYVFLDKKIAEEIKNTFIDDLNYFIKGSPTVNFWGKTITKEVKVKDLEKWELAKKTMRVMTINMEKMISEDEV